MYLERISSLFLFKFPFIICHQIRRKVLKPVGGGGGAISITWSTDGTDLASI